MSISVISFYLARPKPLYILYESTHFDNLFRQVSATLRHHEDLDRVSGENFNIFRILKMQSDEVRLHSAFIGDLLDPKGAHGQGKVFLDLFIATCLKDTQRFDTNNCSLHIEYHTGSMNKDKTAGGRIDLLLRDRANKHIIIENKIHASDQMNQLLRYFNKAEHVELLYLTLDGRLPDKVSCGHLEADIHFYCISYEYHILSWLQQCRKEVAVLPLIREGLSQYINLVRYLTNQTSNHQMQKTLNAIMKDNLKASFTIKSNWESTLDYLSAEFGQTVKAAFADSDFDCTYEIDFHRNYSGIWFSRKAWKYVRIGFQFQSKNREMLYGFAIQEGAHKQPVAVPLALKQELLEIENGITTENGWWCYRQYLEQPYGDWTKYEAWEAV